MLEIIQNIFGFVFIAIGIFIVISGSLGMLRFPDIFARLHAAGVTDSLGAPLVIFGVMILEGFTIVALKLFLLILLILLTSPTACHALAKAAYLVQDKTVKARKVKKT
jgi:multicomponent Na+:H+ antiporter subunit G